MSHARPNLGCAPPDLVWVSLASTVWVGFGQVFAVFGLVCDVFLCARVQVMAIIFLSFFGFVPCLDRGLRSDMHVGRRAALGCAGVRVPARRLLSRVAMGGASGTSGFGRDPKRKRRLTEALCSQHERFVVSAFRHVRDCQIRASLRNSRLAWISECNGVALWDSSQRAVQRDLLSSESVHRPIVSQVVTIIF